MTVMRHGPMCVHSLEIPLALHVWMFWGLLLQDGRLLLLSRDEYRHCT